MKQYEIIEDNGGGLHLFVFNADGKCVYTHTDYEYTKGQLCNDLKRLWTGEDPAEWDGNCGGHEWQYGTDPETMYREMLESEGRDIVADNDGLYVDRMGAASRREFDIH